MNATFTKLMEAGIAAAIEHDRAWLPHDRRGRWVVIEPGAGCLLRGTPAYARQVVDAVTPRRARRFSSLSRARAFASEVDGVVRRWRRTPPGGGIWGRWSTWDRARAAARRATTW